MNRKRLFERFDDLRFDSERRFPRRSTENHNVLGLHRNSRFEARRHPSLDVSLGTHAPERLFRLRIGVRRRNARNRSRFLKGRYVQTRRMNRSSRVLPASYRGTSRSGRRFGNNHYQRRSPKPFRLSRFHHIHVSRSVSGERIPAIHRFSGRRNV